MRDVCGIGCAQPPPSHSPPSHSTTAPSTEATERAAESTLAGTAWVVEPPPPLIRTQLSPRCHELLSNLAATSATLRFDEDRVSMHANSLGGLALTIDPTFGWSRDQDSHPEVVRVEAEGWAPPYGVLLPCGLPLRELRVAPSGERLTSNVIACGPCAQEPAIDGLVGLSWHPVSGAP